MADQLSSVLRDTYVRDGAACARGALTSEEVTFLRSRVEGLLAQHDETRPLGDDAIVFRYEGGAYFECLSRKFPEIRERLMASRLPRLAAEIMGVSRVTFWRDEIHYKFAGDPKNATPWHHDAGSSPFVGNQVLTVWTSLTDVTLADSPLRTMTRSHEQRSARLRPPSRDHSMPPIPGFIDGPDFTALAERGEVEVATWTTRPGDTVMFHPYTMHGSLPNEGLHPRMAFVTRWLGADARWCPTEYSVLDGSLTEDVLVDGKPAGAIFPTFETAAQTVPACQSARSAVVSGV